MPSLAFNSRRRSGSVFVPASHPSTNNFAIRGKKPSLVLEFLLFRGLRQFDRTNRKTELGIIEGIAVIATNRLPVRP